MEASDTLLIMLLPSSVPFFEGFVIEEALVAQSVARKTSNLKAVGDPHQGLFFPFSIRRLLYDGVYLQSTKYVVRNRS